MGHASSPPRPDLLPLLRAVKASPDDEALGRVLADWLEENGDEADRARAALIRVQWERQRTPYRPEDAAWERLREQEEDLQRRYAAEWLGPLRQSNVKWQFRRGLVHLETNLGVVVAWRNRLWPQTEAWAWVERARLVNGAPADVAKLAESPAPGSLTALELVAARPDPAAAAALARSPHLANLSRLGVIHFGPAGAVALATSAHLTRLTALSLLGNDLENQHVVELLEAPCLGRLTELGLTGNWLNDEAVGALANCPRLANVKTLRLMANHRLGDAGLVALATSPYLGNLEHLEWTGQGGEAGAQALLDSPHLSKLRFIYGPPYGQLPAPLRQRLRERFALSGHGP